MDIEIEILKMLEKKSHTGDPEIPLDIFEEELGKHGFSLDQIKSNLDSLRQNRYIAYECESAKIIKKGFDRLKELGY